MARTLVTGAGGFVGPHLRAALEAAGHEVWTTDRTPAAAAPRHRPADLTDAGAMRAVLEDARPDAVVHLASQSSVAASFQDPVATLLGNLTAACNLLEAIRQLAPRARVLVIGSAEEYGNVPEAEQPIRESQPLRPASPYAVSKCAQELLALQYAMSWGLDVVATRSFNHSGPGQSDRFVLSSFARQIAAAERGAQEAVLRVGNLDVRRDFLDVRDVVRAYVALLERGERGAVYNVCRGEAPAVRDLLDALRAAARVATRVETDPERWRPSDLPVLRGDPARLVERTGWCASLPLDATLRDLLADWRARLAVEPAR